MIRITPEGHAGFTWGLIACIAGLSFAYYLQYFQDLEPCPMCIFQRIAMFGCGLVFLLGIPLAKRLWARWLVSLLAIASALAGAGIAARHVWLQGLPPDQVPSCGPPLEALTAMMPWSEVFTVVLRGDGSCAVIDAAFLGLSLPGWTLLCFVALALWALLCGIASASLISSPQR